MYTYFSKIWPFLHDHPHLFPYPSVLPHLFFSKALWSLPFLAFGSSLKHPIVSLLRSWNVLSLHPFTCPILSATSPLNLPGNHDSLSHWLMTMGVMVSWDSPGRSQDSMPIALNGLMVFLHLPFCLWAPLCVWRWAFHGVTAPLMVLGQAGAGDYLGSPAVTTPFFSFVCMETSFLSYNLIPFTKLLFNNWQKGLCEYIFAYRFILQCS